MNKSANRILFIIAIFLFALFMDGTKAQAQESTTAVFMGGWSKHFEDGNFNESHEMIAVQYDKVVAGTFINSYDKRGYLLGYDAWKMENEYLTGGVFVALVTGYDLAPVLPLPMPYLQLNLIEINDIEIKPTLLIWGKAAAITINLEF